MRLAIGHFRSGHLPDFHPPSGRLTCRSMSVPQAQRASLAERWAEYQGCRNWEGLLDPMDPNLRSEILRYGKFVQTAYKAFDFDPASLSYATCKHPRQEILSLSGLPDSGYVPTKNLHATSGIQLPGWVDRAPAWISRQSSWMGFVAVAEHDATVSKLGRRDVVIAYRGTVTCLEWLENMRSMLTDLGDSRAGGAPSSVNGAAGLECCSVPMVLSGFWSLFTSRPPGGQSLQEEVREEVGRLLERYKGEPISLTITGHSLGAALAVLTADDIATTFSHRTPLVTVYSFGGPRVGNRSFRRQVERHGSKVLRIVNNQDVVTKVPGFVFRDDDDELTVPSPCQADHHHLRHYQQLQGELIKKLVDARWAYAEVGRELRLSSGESPSLRSQVANVATCHELDFYLNLVNSAS